MLLYYCRTQQWPIPRSLNVTEPHCWSMSLQHSEAFTNCLERWTEHTHIICCTGWDPQPRHTMIYRPRRLQCCLSASHWTISISACTIYLEDSAWHEDFVNRQKLETLQALENKFFHPAGDRSAGTTGRCTHSWNLHVVFWSTQRAH